VWLNDAADLGERRDDRGKQSGHVLGAEDALAPLRALPPASPTM
jgi:hypothetical protein